jgi:hypothetical protein
MPVLTSHVSHTDSLFDVKVGTCGCHMSFSPWE